MRVLIPFAVAVLLVGCFGSSEPTKPRKTSAERRQAAEEALAKTPVPRTYRYPDGDLKVFEVPVRDGSGFVDAQRCFVWRDEAFKTANISCGQMPDVLLSN